MPKEIEKRYLVQSELPSDLGEPKLIKQGYVILDKKKHLRVRVIGNKSFLCLKFTETEIRDEYEYEIPLKDGLEILSKCKYVIEKIRVVLHPIDNSYTIDVDTYPNGLVVAEVEFKSKEDADAFKPIDWFGPEITGVAEYTNVALAKQKLKF